MKSDFIPPAKGAFLAPICVGSISAVSVARSVILSFFGRFIRECGPTSAGN